MADCVKLHGPFIVSTVRPGFFSIKLTIVELGREGGEKLASPAKRQAL